MHYHKKTLTSNHCRNHLLCSVLAKLFTAKICIHPKSSHAH